MTRDRANAGPLPDRCSCVSYWQTNDSLSWPALSSQEMFLKFCSKFTLCVGIGQMLGYM